MYVGITLYTKESFMMNYRMQVCSNAMYQEQYMTFVLENHVKLPTPHPLLFTLGFTPFPLFLEEECFISLDSSHEVVGAWSYLYGTAEDAYYNTDIVQIQSIIFSSNYRKTKMFTHALQHLVQYIDESERGIKEVRFWIASDSSLQRLCSKLATQTSTLATPQGMIEEYRVPFHQLYDYAMRLHSKQHAIQGQQ